MQVVRRDGIHFEGERTVVADARSAVGDVNVVSHAHTDHLLRGDAPVVCSPATAAIAAARSGADYDVVSAPGVELVPAGHVIGSRAALVDGADGRRYCYTGDFSIRDRGPLEGFDPDAVDADVLVMETTYGRPRYTFPPQAALEGEITDWLADISDRPLVLFGYALGRAQTLELLAAAATDRTVLVTPAVGAVDRAIETATDGAVALPGRAADPETLADLTDEIVVAPGTQRRADWVERLVDRTGARLAGFSGWALESAFRYRGGYDVAFPLTDHCGYDELLETVAAIDPAVVYTHHGAAVAFADDLATEHGREAHPLFRRQRTLGEFT